MSKFSFYELFSFIFPGFVFIVTINELYLSINKFNDNDLATSLIIIILSLVVGLIIHIINTFLISNIKLFRWLIMPSVQYISQKNNFIQKTIPFLNQEYLKVRQHDEPDAKDNEAAPNLFDFAYHYLEVNGKIEASKHFQSFYFLFRNLFFITIAIIILICFSLNLSGTELLLTIGGGLLSMVVFAFTARWSREKMVEKIFWSYYIERVYKI